VSAKLTDADGGGYRLVGLQARLGDSDLSGDVTVALGGARPRLDATLVSNRLDLKDFGVEPAAAAPATGDGRLFPADPLPLDGLRAADATVELNAQTVVRGPVALENVRLKLTLTNGKLAVAPFAADLAGGSVEAVVDLDAGGDVPAVGTKLTARQVEAGALLRTLGISEVLSGGRLDLDVDVRGGGESVRAIMAGLDGTASLQMGAGRIDDGFVELLLADLVKLISFGGAGDNSTINCLVGGFDIENGLAVSRGLVLDTPGAAIVGSGRIHLDSEKLDLHFQPKAKQTNLVNLAIPVNVGGTLASPRVTPDPVGTVTGVVGGAVGFATGGVAGVLGALTGSGGASGGGEENPCAAAPVASPPPTSVPERVLGHRRRRRASAIQSRACSNDGPRRPPREGRVPASAPARSSFDSRMRIGAAARIERAYRPYQGALYAEAAAADGGAPYRRRAPAPQEAGHAFDAAPRHSGRVAASVVDQGRARESAAGG
jgi:hypothetical protein